jgi:hypothetical protein
MAKKTQVEFTSQGFITENHWDETLLGRNEWKWDDHFGIEGDTIREDKIPFVKYLISRGINESVQNSYQAHAKGTGLEPRRVAFNRRVADLMAGIWERAKTSRAEPEIDLDAMTLKVVVAKSLMKEYDISPAECKALLKSVEFAAQEVARRNGLDAKEILATWKQRAEDDLSGLPM